MLRWRRVLVLVVPVLVLAAGFVALRRHRSPGPSTHWIIPAGHESAVLKFLEPLHMGAAVADGYTLDDVVIDGGTIRLSLKAASSGRKTTVEVLPSADGAVVRPAADTPASVADAIRQTLGRSPRPASPWVAVEERAPEPPPVASPKTVLGSDSSQGSSGTLARASHGFAEVAAGAGRAVRDAFRGGAHWVGQAVHGVWSALVGAENWTLNGIRSVARGGWNTLADWSRSIRTFVWVAVSTMYNGARSGTASVFHRCSLLMDQLRETPRLTRQIIWPAVSRPANHVGATMVVLLVAVVVLAARRVRSIPLPVLSGIAGLTGLAFLLRFWMSPHAFMHEYYHIYNWPDLFSPNNSAPYGLTGPVLFRAADRLLGGQERAVFTLNMVLATVTIPVVVLFDYALFGKWSRALLAGLIVCLMPVHLRFSASEELWVPGALFAYLSLAAWAFWLRGRDTTALVISVLALSLAMQSRPELLVLPLAHVGLVLAVKPRKEWLRTTFSLPVLIGFVALVGLVAFRVFDMLRSRDDLPHQFFPSFAMLQSENTLVEPLVMPPALLALAVIGAAWGLVYQRKITLWVIGLTAAYVIIPLTAYGNRPCIYRTQMFGLTLLAASAAGAPEWVMKLNAAARWRAVAMAGVVFLMVQGLWARRQFVTELLDQQLEYAFLDEAVAKLPGKTRLIAVFDGTNGSVSPTETGCLDNFPAFLGARYNKDIDRLNLPDLGLATPWPSPGPDLVYYQGMSCYAASAASVSLKPMRDECLAIRNRYELRPLNVRTLHTRGYSEAFYAPGPYEIGFFEVVGERTAGTPPT